MLTERQLLIRLFFFFFSSRRRHTRSLCDWSSDVCSSDLRVERVRRPRCAAAGGRQTAHLADIRVQARASGLAIERSEERRVGKECRSAWSPADEKKRS